MATEQEALNEIMEFLEAEPTPDSTGLTSLVTPGNDISSKREQLAVLVSTGKAKEAVGVQLTHDQVKRLSDKEVEKTRRFPARLLAHARHQRRGHGGEG